MIMEKELNIAAILKGKPSGTKFWSDTFGTVELQSACDENIIVNHHHVSSFLDIYGKAYPEGICCIYPSKTMRSWGKFAWKKGDVLCGYLGNLCIFDKWANDQYTEFYGRYPSPTYSKEGDKFDTESWSSGIEGIVKITFIKNIEEHYGGKLNLSTLDIEQPKQEFKDGDILVAEKDAYYDKVIFIASIKSDIFSKALIDVDNEDYEVDFADYRYGHNRTIRLATDSEKQQLFDALEKRGKVWNPDTKQIEDLPKMCELKPFDKVLVRDHDNERWEIEFFGYYDEEVQNYATSTGNRWYFCIPYNDYTKHLLGTTDEWKGGDG